VSVYVCLGVCVCACVCVVFSRTVCFERIQLPSRAPAITFFVHACHAVLMIPLDVGPAERLFFSTFSYVCPEPVLVR
jgi:hypothetical protein